MSALNAEKSSSFGVQVRLADGGGRACRCGRLIALAGFAVGGSHVLSATRRWIRDMEVPPGELARIKLSQARSAAAGANAWQNDASARDRAET